MAISYPEFRRKSEVIKVCPRCVIDDTFSKLEGFDAGDYIACKTLLYHLSLLIFHLPFSFYYFPHPSTLKMLTSSLTILEEANRRNSIITFTESLTELLREELFPKVTQQLLGLLNILCNLATTVTAMKRFKLEQTNPSEL